jgi:LuxR family transcriptional regulator, maltose regulon positive regulatory protein
MPSRRPQLAKLTRPRLHNAVARLRLFELLDDARDRPIIWVCGPPGAGKTTLVASYLERIGTSSLWYQLDNADGDPATFFHFLAHAFAAAELFRGKPLTRLTAEYLPDLEGFSQRFFSDAFARQAQGSLLVLDNYHEVAENSALHRALNAAFTEIPQSMNVVVISRNPPPSLFARLHVVDRLTVVGWDALRLSEEETAAIVARRDGADAHIAASIHNQACGWAAGVRLLLERIEAGGGVVSLDRPEGLEQAFDYFAAEIFDRASKSVQQVLLRTAFLPRFTASVAASITGDRQAGRRIEELYRRRLFIDRLIDKEVTYQYHDLFRVFLQTRAECMLPAGEVAVLSGKAAVLFQDAGLIEDAFALSIQARDWDHAEQLFLDNAPTMIAQGRWQTLQSWCAALPQVRLETNPWIRFWLGRSNSFVDPGAACAIAQRAFESFLDRGDKVGQLFACAGVVDALHHEVRNYLPLKAWLLKLTRLLEVQTEPLSANDDLWIHSTILLASAHCSPANSLLPTYFAKVEELLPRCTDVNLKVYAARMLHYAGVESLDPEAVQIATRVARPVMDFDELSADRIALYYLAEGYSHYTFARYPQALACFDSADAVIGQHGLTARVLVSGIWKGICELRSGNIQAATATVARIDKQCAADNGFGSYMFAYLKALLMFERGDRDHAVALGLSALKRCEDCGFAASLALMRLNIAFLLIEAGHHEHGCDLLAAIDSQAEIGTSSHFAGAIALLRAFSAHRIGDKERCELFLRQAMAFAREEPEKVRMRWFPRILRELLPLALEHDIEIEVARVLIRECKLSPPSSLPEAWPWPVRIYTLGRFEVLVNDAPLEFGRKAPTRTMALLKAVIALGGKDIDENRLCDALWPDLDGDAARNALAAALYRLRRLLGSGDIIRQLDGMLSLNSQCCFVDAWTFETGVELSAGRQALLHLYRGDFLHGDTAAWTASMRERVRGKFVRALQATARELETLGQFDEAIELYCRGVEADDLVEPFYQGLIRSYQCLGRRAEAASAYRRLRQTLSITLGLEPEPESQRLFAELRY